MTQQPPDDMALLPQTARALLNGMNAGLHIGFQIFVSQRGQIVADAAGGLAQPGIAMTPHTLMCWLSASKPIAAIAIAQLRERGLLEIDDTIASFIPDFAQHGKEGITLRHVLTHTAGLRRVHTGWPRAPWEQIIHSLCASTMEPGWEAGMKAGYDANTSWFLLGEVVARVDGRAFSQYVRESIFQPLGMGDCWIGMPEDQYAEYARSGRLGILQVTSRHPPFPLAPFDSAVAMTNPRPSSSGCGPIRQLGRLYQALLDGGTLDGTTILQPQSVKLFTARTRVGMFDHTFNHKMDWGLGFMVNSRRYNPGVTYGFGPGASDELFGHNGMQSSSTFADPAHALGVALVFNGLPGPSAHERRMDDVLGAVYKDLKLELKQL